MGAALGGSWAYIAMESLACQRRIADPPPPRRRRHLCGLRILTLAWALREVGLDRWTRIPRSAFLTVVGRWLLALWISRPLARSPTDDAPAETDWRGPRGWLAGAMVLVIIATVASMLRNPSMSPVSRPSPQVRLRAARP